MEPMMDNQDNLNDGIDAKIPFSQFPIAIQQVLKAEKMAQGQQQTPTPSIADPALSLPFKQPNQPQQSAQPKMASNVSPDIYDQYGTTPEKAAKQAPVVNTSPDIYDQYSQDPNILHAPKEDKMYRFATGLQDPAIGVGQAVVHGVSDINDPTQKEYQSQVDQSVNQREEEYKKNHAVEGIDWSRLAGNVVSPANALLPLKAIAAIDSGGSALMRIAKGALAGGTNMAAQPTETSDNVSYAGGKTLQVGTGAATGGALNAATGAIADAIKPTISKDVETLINHGVRVPTDQMSGEGGSKLTSVPIMGSLIKANHNRAVEDVNTAVLNKSLSNIGEKLPPTVEQFGNEALTHTRERLSNAYDTLLPTLNGNINEKTTNVLGQHLLTDGSVIGGNKPMSFHDKFAEMMKDKYHDMDLPTANRLGTILQKRITGMIANDGSFTGDQFKIIESGLTNDMNNYAQSGDPQHIMLKNALSDVRGLLKDQLASQNPEGAQQLKNINRGYSIFKVAQKAASSTAAPNGVFNPSQLYNAVKGADKTLDKRAFTEGDTPLYDLASSAKNILTPYKDSGTAGRELAAAGASAIATGGIKSLFVHPVGTALGAMGAAYYTQPGQAIARAAMTKRPEVAGALSALARKYTDVSNLSPYAHE